MYYNAYEKDIAIVNIFFGDSTVFGESESHIEIQIRPQMLLLQNLKGHQR